MYRHLYAVVALFFAGANAYAQTPEWIRQLPLPSDTYYYRIGQASADTEEKAYTKALARTVCESAIAADFPVDMQKMLSTEDDTAFVEMAREVNIPVNVVCRHTEKLVTRSGYKVYLLCQVSNKAGRTPRYKQFNCWTNKEY
jgi:hypothetical protein